MSLENRSDVAVNEGQALEAPLIAEPAPLSGDVPARVLLPPMTAAAEARSILSLGMPLVMEELLSYGSTLLSIAVVGRLPAPALAVFFSARCAKCTPAH